MRVLLFRHAETAWTISGQHTGRTDLELTLAGEAEARAAAALFRRLLGTQPLDAVYSSPRKRALRTAELALENALEPTISDLITEFDYGSYEGLTSAEIELRAPGWSIWDHGCPGGESLEAVAARADQFIALLRQRHAEHTVCVVSHGHLLRVLTARMLDLDARQGRLFSISTASLADLAQHDGYFVLSRWNFTA